MQCLANPQSQFFRCLLGRISAADNSSSEERALLTPLDTVVLWREGMEGSPPTISERTRASTGFRSDSGRKLGPWWGDFICFFKSCCGECDVSVKRGTVSQLTNRSTSPMTWGNDVWQCISTVNPTWTTYPCHSILLLAREAHPLSCQELCVLV